MKFLHEILNEIVKFLQNPCLYNRSYSSVNSQSLSVKHNKIVQTENINQFFPDTESRTLTEDTKRSIESLVVQCITIKNDV